MTYTKQITHDSTDYEIVIEAEDEGELEGWEGGDVLGAEVIDEG